MYDSMELDEAISDLYDIGIKDDTLVLLSKANRNIKLCVQTPYGLTEPHIIESVIAQGDSWAPLAASVQVDSLGSQLLEEERKQGSMDLYKYKGEVSIGILGMQDDTAAVTLAGTQAHLMNAYMNAQSATKHLRFNSKCKFMNIGAHKDIFSTSSLDVDSWETKYELDGSCCDIYIGKKEMQHTDEHKYLGFVISSDGTNLPNILSKQNKSANIIRQIKCMIECLGTYTFECAFIYMRSLLRSSILYAAETYYNLTEKEVQKIESIEENCLRQILKTGHHCSIALIYLETGWTPARYQIELMKLRYLFDILQHDSNSLLLKFFTAQINNPVKGDWVSEVSSLIKDLCLTFDDIKLMKQSKFELLIKNYINQKAVTYLKNKIK